MASRPIWRGHLRLALVSCPVALYSAHHDRSSVHFNLINPATGNRVKMVTLDAETEDKLERRDLVKGWEFKKGHYVIVTDEDMKGVSVESSETISVEKFVDEASIDPIYFDASYYLAPEGRAGLDVYAVLREAIGKTGRVALARVVISQRERTIAIRPMGNGLVVQTLYDDQDLNDASELFEGADAVRTDPEMVTLATQLIDRQTGSYDPKDVEDRYEARLRAMLAAKVDGIDPEDADEAAPVTSNVVDLMAALRKSLGPGPWAGEAAGAEKKTPAKRSKAPSAAAQEEGRRQAALKLPIAGGKKAAARVEKAAVQKPSAGSRRRA